MIESERFKAALKHGLDAHKLASISSTTIETVIDKRLDELTPQLSRKWFRPSFASIWAGWWFGAASLAA